MDTIAVNQFFVLFTWFVLIALIMLILLIARFYQNFSGEATYFRWFVLPIVFLGIASVRYTSIDKLAGDEFADVLLGVGGLILLVLCSRIYWIMVIQRKNSDTQSLE